MDIKWFKGIRNSEDAFVIRNEVFVKEQYVPVEEELDDQDKICDHLVIYLQGEPVATGRIIIENKKYYLGRVAVLKKYRGKGFGKILVNELLNKIFLQGEKEVFIHAQVSAEGFYKKLGFKPYGEKFFEAGIEHINMCIIN